MDTFFQDVRYAWRRLVHSPGFSAVAVVTLALGIGANSAIFSVVNGVLLKPLPYPNPGELFAIFHVTDGQRAAMSGPNFWDVSQQARTLASTAALATYRAILTGQGDPVRLDAAEVTGRFFTVLGTHPLLGRALADDDCRPKAPRVVVLGEGLWQQRFGGRPDIIGTRITLDGVPTEVVGIMPAGFAYPAGRVLWTAAEYTESFTTSQRGAWYLTVLGRARAGVPVEQVAAEVEAIGRQLATTYPNSNDGVGFTAVPLLEATVGRVRKAVLVLLGAVAVVLLIACVNVANLLLARGASRESEIAVRAALGAGRGRLIRQLLTESVILGVLGAALGLLVAVWGVEILIGLQPQGIPRLDNVEVEGRVVLFTASLAVVTAIIFGLFPAVHATRAALAGNLKEGARRTLTSRSASRLRGGLVIAEVALAVVLLAGAGLLVRSFARLAAVDPGFPQDRALTFELSLPDARYEGSAQQVAFFDQLLPRLAAIPGVRAAGAVLGLPLSGMRFGFTFEVDGRPPLPPAQQPAMQVRVATPSYFSTLGIPLKRGRLFDHKDREGAPQVAVITESAARAFFPGEDPLGRKIKLGWGSGPGAPNAGGEIVGIVGDVKDAGLSESEAPQVYLPYAQRPVQLMAVVLKTTVPPESVAAAARRAVAEVDPLVPLGNLRTLEDILLRSLSQPRFYMLVLAIFAVMALLLAAIGVFGVLSYAVAQRTREIGIRMALGARGTAVVRLILAHAFTLAACGIGAGTFLAWLLSKALLTGLLFETDPRDATTFTVVAVTLGAVALLAAYIPARRATRVDPITALRAE